MCNKRSRENEWLRLTWFGRVERTNNEYIVKKIGEIREIGEDVGSRSSR